MVLGINQAKRKIVIKRLNDAYICAKRCLTDSSYTERFISWCDRLQELADEFNSVHFKILSKLDAENEDTFNEEDSYRQQFDETYSDILEIKCKIFGVERPISGNNSSHDISPSDNDYAKNKSAQVKLPRLTLTPFDGNYKNFLSFRDLYDSLIHTNKSLSKVEKFSYLLSSLRGPALELIKVFPLSESNYDVAYNTFVSRYENKRHLAFIAWEAIRDCKLVANDATSLRKLLDIVSENLSILKNLNLPVGQWDFVLFHTLLTKLDTATRKEFEMTVTSSEIPSFGTLKDFLNKYCQAWELSSSTSGNEKPTDRRAIANVKKINHYTQRQHTTTTLVASNAANTDIMCIHCSQGHFISQCPDFQSLAVPQRFEIVKNKKWCVNCLRPTHSTRTCRSKSNCRHCGRRHHSLLHFPAQSVPASAQSVPTSAQSTSTPVTASVSTTESAASSRPVQPNSTVSVLTNTISTGRIVVLSTARVEVKDRWGNFQEVRVLLDSGSQAHFMTDACARRLGLPKYKSEVPIFGLSNQEVKDLGKVNCSIRPRCEPETLLTFDAFIVPRICGDMPSSRIDNSTWTTFNDITVADPYYCQPGHIDVLIGAELWPSILLPGSIPATDTTPMALNTIFGWVFMGAVPCRTLPKVNVLLAINDHILNTTIKKFWEVEDVPHELPISLEDALCEEHFSKSHCRDTDGRYIVELPMKNDTPQYKEMKPKALRKFYYIEKRLLQNANWYLAYNQFMRDYLDLDHMSKVPEHDTNRSDAYYIPHHSVINENSSSTRLRVVFNASDPDSEGNSLNQNQLIGPKLQTDISGILLRFRLHNIVMTTDVKQMYRQILVSPKHRHFQRILWRFDPSQPVSEYELNTVTYGVSSSPFLAIRVIQQLVRDEGSNYPLAAAVLNRDIYVDDIAAGAQTLDEALELRTQLTELMRKGCFELRKWASNDPRILEDLPSDHCLSKSQTFDLDQDNFIKVLGLRWDPTSDNFTYKVQPITRRCTKRTMLSELARIFDPLGFLAPLTFFAKCLIQKLWLLGTDWDDEPSPEIQELWSKYVHQLPQLSKFSIPRHITHTDAVSYHLHGFGDASQAGYGAVVYLRYDLPDGTVMVHLISAKSKVAPIKQWTLPRLELAAAVLLSDLICFILQALSPLICPSAVYAWTDSMITLAWIKSSPLRWKTFIANRVSHIQRKLPQAVWNHVDTKSNPADCVSRGLLPEQLVDHPLWLHGPEWLVQAPELWPRVQISSQAKLLSELEQKKTALVSEVRATDEIQRLLSRFSSLKKIQRIVAYVQRFLNRARKRPCLSGPITSTEMEMALQLLVSYTQDRAFSGEIEQLAKNKLLSKPMRKLCPFLDAQSILRVGGRLTNAPLGYDVRHPMLLPKKSRLTELVIQDVHESHLHPGPQAVQFLLNQKFWVLSAKHAIKSCISRCIRCFRVKPTGVQPIMASLPSNRVSGVKAFAVVGCDYAGPLNVIVGKRKRGVRSEKMYLCIFVCFATKAIHIEIASDLSSEAFIAALRRFIARRGRCSQIISDCGTNFVGAYRQLAPLMKNAAQSEHISFKTHPPSAPHFSGLAEAGVKSIKTHLHRVIGSQILTYEELHTLIVQVEAVLNSRPLCAVSNDPSDLSVLTPGHFLTLEPLTAVPEIPEAQLKLNNRWHHLQRLHRDFWRRWYHDYLNSLMQRTKWYTNSGILSIGDLVLIKEDDLRPMQWRLGRIIDVHPGSDGVIRVATVRTQSGIMKRPSVKLCPLPLPKD